MPSLLLIILNFTFILFSVCLMFAFFYLNFNNVFFGDLLVKNMKSKIVSFFFFKREVSTSFVKYFCYDSSLFQSI